MKERLPGLDVVWRAFELRPHPAPTLDPKGDYLQTAWSQGVYPLAERLGMTMRLPPVQPRSRLAHEAAAWAREQGGFDAMHEGIFRAFFEDGRDIGDVGVLAEIARAAGLDAAEMRQELAEHVHLGEVLEDERQAERYGLRGVPAFVANGFAMFGVQTVDGLEEFVRRASEVDARETRDDDVLPHPPVRLKRGR